MARSWKKLGLTTVALVAVVVAGAVVISGAQAEESSLPHYTAFNTMPEKLKDETATIYGSIEEGPQVLRTFSKTLCYHVQYEGTLAKGLDELLTMKPKFFGTKAATMAPECETEGETENWPTEVEMNGCTFAFPLTTEVSTVTYTSKTKIICEGKNEIDIKVTKPEGVCTVRIPPQEIAHTWLFNQTTVGNRKGITIEPEWQGFSYSTEGVFCGVAEKTWNNGEYKGKMTLNALAGKEPLDLTIKPVTTP